MRVGRITVNTQAVIDNPDHYARLFASIFFIPMQINHIPFDGMSEYIGHCHLFDDIDTHNMIPAYDVQLGSVERKTLNFIKRGNNNG